MALNLNLKESIGGLKIWLGARAVSAIRKGEMGLKKASRSFNVPRPTLQRLARTDKPPEEAASTKLGRKPLMSDDMEKELVDICY